MIMRINETRHAKGSIHVGTNKSRERRCTGLAIAQAAMRIPMNVKSASSGTVLFLCLCQHSVYMFESNTELLVSD